MENTNETAKLVAGVCPQCGGQLEVDPAQDAAVCPYCGTPYVVSKAINNYTVQNAHIDHVDHVNVDLKGSISSLIGLAEREFVHEDVPYHVCHRAGLLAHRQRSRSLQVNRQNKQLPGGSCLSFSGNFSALQGSVVRARH